MLSQDELNFIERFCDKYVPETKGECIVNRIDRVDSKLKDLLLGLNGLNSKLFRNFPNELKNL
jgi:hypothetical protein